MPSPKEGSVSRSTLQEPKSAKTDGMGSGPQTPPLPSMQELDGDNSRAATTAPAPLVTRRTVLGALGVGGAAIIAGGAVEVLGSKKRSSRLDLTGAGGAGPLPKHLEVTPSIPPTTEAPRLVDKSADTLLIEDFGYSKEQLDKLKERLGPDLGKYRYVVTLGDPAQKASRADTNIVFNFGPFDFDEVAYKTQVEKIRSMDGSNFSGLDPFRDGSSVNAQLVRNTLDLERIVLYIDPSDPSPAWTRGATHLGLTNPGYPHSIIRVNSALNSTMVSLIEGFQREATFTRSPSSKYGAIYTSYSAEPFATLALRELVFNSAAEIVVGMKMGLSEEQAKARVTKVPPRKFLETTDFFTLSPLDGVSFEKFSDSKLWK